MNGNGSRRPFNPYGDPTRLVRKEGGSDQSQPQYGNRHYAASLGENEYSEIDNFDINSGGKLVLNISSNSEIQHSCPHS